MTHVVADRECRRRRTVSGARCIRAARRARIIVAYPWIAGFADVPTARNVYIVAGAALFLVWVVTDYRAAEAQLSTIAMTGIRQSRQPGAVVGACAGHVSGSAPKRFFVSTTTAPSRRRP